MEQIDHRAELLAPECLDGALVRRQKSLAFRDRLPDLLDGARFERGRHRFGHHDAPVAGVPEVARGRVGDIRGGVVTAEVVAHLDLQLHHADYREPEYSYA